MYCVTGVGLSPTKYYANDHKKARWNRDVWDKVGWSDLFMQNGNLKLTFLQQSMWSCPITIEQQVTGIFSDTNDERAVMERDFRITGTMRGQSTNPEAPTGFEVSNPWKVRDLCLVGNGLRTDYLQ